jgi:molybdate transport system substrate-binding protein
MMAKRSRTSVGILALFLALLAAPGAGQCQIRVMTSGGFAAPLKAALPDFEKSSGITVTVILGKSQGAGPDTIAAQLGRGVGADVVILSREGLNDLAADGKIVAGSEADLARTPLGMAVKAGARKPDIATVAAFKETLLRARSITYPSSTTGIYMATKLFPQMGIAKEVAAKSSNAGIASVAKGEAEIAIQPVSELLHVPGTDFVGTLPQSIQYISVFSAGLVKDAGSQEQARKLVEFLTSAKAAGAMRSSGMEPMAAH